MTNVTLTTEQAARQLLEVAEGIQHGTDWNNGTHAKIYRPKFPEATTALREALDHSADSGKLIPQFIPVGIVNDHHSIDWMEEIVDDQAPIGAILYALQDSVGRNVSFVDESVCNWHQDDDDGTWATDCGGIFVIIEGTPSDNKMKFCAYCGKPLVEHPFVDSEDEQ